MDGVALTEHEPFPLTDLQEAYVVGMSRLVELGGFLPSFYAELDVAGLDLDRAEVAVNQLISHHDHLRTVVLPDGTQRVLSVGEAGPFSLRVADLAGIGPDRQEAAIRQTRALMSEHGVDPARWPLFDIAVSRIRPHRARVHIAMSLLLLDGRGIRQVAREWRELYQDPRSVLATAPMTFRDCVLTLLANRESARYSRQWRYWEARLRTLPGAPRLPLARPPESIDPVRFTRRVCHLSAVQWQRLCATFRQHRLLPTTAMLHLFAETLGAWAADPRFCVNVLHQGWSASHEEWSSVVGQFGATIPVEVSGNGTFWERALRTQRQLWSDLENGDVSAVRIAREMAIRQGQRPRAMLPYVFTSMLPSGTDHAARPAALPACRTVYSSMRTPQVLIDNQVMEAADGGVDSLWDIVDDAFPAGLPDLMFAAYRDMARTVAEPDEALTMPDPVPAGHRRRVAELNSTSGAPPAGRLEDGFLKRAASQPAAPALVAPGVTMTYQELERVSRIIAVSLTERGIGREDVVPLVMAKGWQQVAGVLGILRAGAAYCPVDAGLPAERIRMMVADCSARIVLVQPGHAPDLGATAVTTLIVDMPDAGDARAPRPGGGRSSDLAYVIYTSGSTGRPKGVMVEHRAALNTVLDIGARVGLGPQDRVFGISSLSFDLSVWDIFGTLGAGGCLVIPESTAQADPVGWAAAAGRNRITVWNSVPALAELLAEAAGEGSGGTRWPIRCFLLSGDWIPVSLPGKLRALWPEARIIALGGATEASIWSNSYDVGTVDPAWHSIPYGTPLRHQTMTVRDHALGLRPPWATGRIYIGGAGLARGYWRDDERTSERFIRHPDTAQRLYWTGDLGRYLPDGTIELLGREDRQVKIQGFRVEPGEVEAAIRSHPAVRDCVVCAEESRGHLVSLVVARPGEHLGAAGVLAHARARLPHYMVPRRIRLADRLPLTPNGKTDHHAVLAMMRTAQDHGAAGRPVPGPDEPLVRRLCELWAELAGVPRVGPDDDFLALGGSSLQVLRLVNRLRAESGIELAFGDVFGASSARGLAACIGKAGRPRDGGRPGRSAVQLAGGPGRELFLFHPVGGSVACYRELARAWAGPVHAFQSRGLAGNAGDDGDPDLETMAARYRAEVERISPDGRCLLGGWSMGGVLAYEVGRQLSDQGRECDVFIIDSELADSPRLTDDAAVNADFLMDLAGGHLPAAVISDIRSGTGDPSAVAWQAALAHQLLPAATGISLYRRLVAIYARNADLLARYRAGLSDLPVLLFVAGKHANRPDPVPAWRAACAGLETEELPCDHHSIAAGEWLAEIAARVWEWQSARTP
ncbi:MAG: amino acid adenylation domain-containing protein [Streptosporangiaceae bacterium]|nr:amino acid adenylation domain-containing protein [Streptosporangiaceae bacterium]